MVPRTRRRRRSDRPRKLAAFTSALLMITLGGVALGAAPVAADDGCTTVSTSRGDMSAHMVAGADDTITGTVDALGCDIGVYIGPGADNVEVDGATVQDASKIGVFNDGASHVNVTRSDILRIGHHDEDGNFDPTGAQTGLGVLYDNGGNGTIAQNDISEYQKGGIVANGIGTEADIRKNTVTGLAENPDIAQNGIQIGFGADGIIHQNDVDSNWFTGADWSASGILVFEADGVDVKKNTVVNSQLGIAVGSFGLIQSTVNNTHITHNTIQDGGWGVSLQAIDFFGDVFVNNTKVVNNRITGMENIGVVGTAFDFTDFDAVLDNNKAIHNKFKDIAGDDIDLDDDDTVKIEANLVE